MKNKKLLQVTRESADIASLIQELQIKLHTAIWSAYCRGLQEGWTRRPESVKKDIKKLRKELGA